MIVFHALRGFVALLQVTARLLFTRILTVLRTCSVCDCLLVISALLSGLFPRVWTEIMTCLATSPHEHSTEVLPPSRQLRSAPYKCASKLVHAAIILRLV